MQTLVRQSVVAAVATTLITSLHKAIFMSWTYTDGCLSWRWCFYINLPPGALVAAALVFSRVPDGEIVKPKPSEVVKDLHNRLDFVGFALFAPSITMLLLAVQWGGNA